MEQIGNELEKVLKAGIGAVATGVEKTKEAIENLAQKGEPIYAQAKDAVSDAAEKIKKAVSESGIADVFSCRPRVESIIADLQEMTQEELDERQVLRREYIDSYKRSLEMQLENTTIMYPDGSKKKVTKKEN